MSEKQFTQVMFKFLPPPLCKTLKGFRDIFISKLDASGNFVYAETIGGSISFTEAYSIVLDTLGNLYTTGHFGNKTDFNSGLGESFLTATGADDIFVLKMNQNGTNSHTYSPFVNNFTIYPNPTDGFFNILLSYPAIGGVIEVYNAMGTLIHKQAVTGQLNAMDLSNDASGLYIVKVFDDNQILSTRKIIRQ